MLLFGILTMTLSIEITPAVGRIWSVTQCRA